MSRGKNTGTTAWVAVRERLKDLDKLDAEALAGIEARRVERERLAQWIAETEALAEDNTAASEEVGKGHAAEAPEPQPVAADSPEPPQGEQQALRHGKTLPEMFHEAHSRPVKDERLIIPETGASAEESTSHGAMSSPDDASLSTTPDPDEGSGGSSGFDPVEDMPAHLRVGSPERQAMLATKEGR